MNPGKSHDSCMQSILLCILEIERIHLPMKHIVGASIMAQQVKPQLATPVFHTGMPALVPAALRPHPASC